MLLNDMQLPEYMRLPKAGERDPYFGLSRSFLNTLILPTPAQPKPPVESKSFRKPHQSRGVRLIKVASLKSYIDNLESDQNA